MPQLQSVFLNWSEAVQMAVISKVAVDFESRESVEAIEIFDAVLEPLHQRDVMRKPEGERIWKYWTMWSEERVEKDTVLQDEDGKQYRATSDSDWSRAGFYVTELIQQPLGQGQP